MLLTLDYDNLMIAKITSAYWKKPLTGEIAYIYILSKIITLIDHCPMLSPGIWIQFYKRV